MTAYHAIFLFVATCAAIVIWRAIGVIERLHWRTHGDGYAHFLGFGLGYVALAAGAFLTAIEVAGGAVTLGALLILVASATLIVFDQRGPRP